MTIQEMHIEFRLKNNKLDSSRYFSFETNEIDMILNIAQEKFISMRYTGLNYAKTGFEETQKRIDDINVLINQFVYKITNNTYFSDIFNTYKVPIQELLNNNDEYLHNVSLGARYVSPECEDRFKIVPISLIQHDDINTMHLDPHLQPSFKYPIYTQLGKMYEIYFGKEIDYTKNNVYIVHKYLKKPIKMKWPDINCELLDAVHREIIDIAVSMTIEQTEDPRIKTFNNNLITE